MLLPNAGAYFLTCYPGEYRDLFWSMPVMVMLATHSLVAMGGFDKKRPDDGPPFPLKGISD